MTDLVDNVAQAIHKAGIVNTTGYAIHGEEARAAIAVVLREIDNREDNDLRAYMLVVKIARENGIEL